MAENRRYPLHATANCRQIRDACSNAAKKNVESHGLHIEKLFVVVMLEADEASD